MADRLEDFQKFRADLNEEILGCGHLGIKRYFALDHQAYEPGPLGTKNKELLGLVASAVLRCDDCITYRSEEHTSELQSQSNLVCRLLLEKKKCALPIAQQSSATPCNRLKKT